MPTNRPQNLPILHLGSATKEDFDVDAVAEEEIVSKRASPLSGRLSQHLKGIVSPRMSISPRMSLMSPRNSKRADASPSAGRTSSRPSGEKPRRNRSDKDTDDKRPKSARTHRPAKSPCDRPAKSPRREPKDSPPDTRKIKSLPTDSLDTHQPLRDRDASNSPAGAGSPPELSPYTIKNLDTGEMFEMQDGFMAPTPRPQKEVRALRRKIETLEAKLANAQQTQHVLAQSQKKGRHASITAELSANALQQQAEAALAQKQEAEAGLEEAKLEVKESRASIRLLETDIKSRDGAYKDLLKKYHGEMNTVKHLQEEKAALQRKVQEVEGVVGELQNKLEASIKAQLNDKQEREALETRITRAEASMLELQEVHETRLKAIEELQETKESAHSAQLKVLQGCVDKFGTQRLDLTTQQDAFTKLEAMMKDQWNFFRDFEHRYKAMMDQEMQLGQWEVQDRTALFEEKIKLSTGQRIFTMQQQVKEAKSEVERGVQALSKAQKESSHQMVELKEETARIFKETTSKLTSQRKEFELQFEDAQLEMRAERDRYRDTLEAQNVQLFELRMTVLSMKERVASRIMMAWQSKGLNMCYSAWKSLLKDKQAERIERRIQSQVETVRGELGQQIEEGESQVRALEQRNVKQTEELQQEAEKVRRESVAKLTAMEAQASKENKETKAKVKQQEKLVAKLQKDLSATEAQSGQREQELTAQLNKMQGHMQRIRSKAVMQALISWNRQPLEMVFAGWRRFVANEQRERNAGAQLNKKVNATMARMQQGKSKPGTGVDDVEMRV